MIEATPTPRRSLLARIFISPDERRLRAGWRLLLQTLLVVFLFVIAGIAVYAPATLLGLSRESLMLAQLTEFLAFTGSIWIARRFLDRRSFVSLGLNFGRQAVIDLLAGIAIAFVMMGAIYLAMVALGWSKFESFAWQSESGVSVLLGALSIFGLFIVVGWNEELLFRGYYLQTIASGLNLTWGVILSSVLFGLAHAGNPGASWISMATAGILFAGLFLAYGYVRTRQLWLSIGLHIGWNFFEGPGFGFPVSGLDVYRIVHQRVQGPELWTGGVFGPEAGLIVLPALALGAVLIYLYSKLPRSAAE